MTSKNPTKTLARRLQRLSVEEASAPYRRCIAAVEHDRDHVEQVVTRAEGEGWPRPSSPDGPVIPTPEEMLASFNAGDALDTGVEEPDGPPEGPLHVMACPWPDCPAAIVWHADDLGSEREAWLDRPDRPDRPEADGFCRDHAPSERDRRTLTGVPLGTWATMTEDERTKALRHDRDVRTETAFFRLRDSDFSSPEEYQRLLDDL